MGILSRYWVTEHEVWEKAGIMSPWPSEAGIQAPREEGGFSQKTGSTLPIRTRVGAECGADASVSELKMIWRRPCLTEDTGSSVRKELRNNEAEKVTRRKAERWQDVCVKD